MKSLLATLLLVLIGGTLLQGQGWRSNLYPEDWAAPGLEKDFYTDAFLQDFSYAGYHRGEVPIPTNQENTVDVTGAPYNADNTGMTDATAAIQAAINQVQADGGGVVFLPAGTYTLSVADDSNEALRISASNVVLRGAGKDQTFLLNETVEMRSKRIIRVEAFSGVNWDGGPRDEASILITHDLRGPTMEIPLASPEQFQAGDDVIIRSPMTNEWVQEHNEAPEWLDVPSTLDGIIHFRTVTGITDTSILIDAPTRYAHLVRDGSYVYKSNANMLAEVGLEDFAIGNREMISPVSDWIDASDGELDNGAHSREGTGPYRVHSSYGIYFERVQNAWMRRVTSFQPAGNTTGTHLLSGGVYLNMCSKLTLDDVYMGYHQYGGGGGNAYSYRIEGNDMLFQNCTAQYSRHGFSFSRMWSSGNVIHDSQCLNSGFVTAIGEGVIRAGSSGSDFHLWFSPSNLIDQMSVDRSYFSAVHRLNVGSAPGHGAVTAHSAFWNFTANNAQSSYGIRTSQTRFGYVVGTQGNSNAVAYELNTDGARFAFRYDVGGLRTMPIDLVEGVGEAANLVPQSLYLDQLDRRLNLTSTEGPLSSAPPLKVFPNPSADGLFTLSESREYTVFDLNGRLLQTGRGIQINLSNQPVGMYLLRAGGWTAKIIRN